MFETEIAEITRNVWGTMFALELDADDEAAPSGDTMTGVVHIDGAWHGAVTVHCSRALAESLTSRLFGDWRDEQVRDLLGELANMLGGNLKPMLPAPCSLSLPAVATGSDYEVDVVDTRVAARTSFRVEGEALVVTLLEKQP